MTMTTTMKSALFAVAAAGAFAAFTARASDELYKYMDGYDRTNAFTTTATAQTACSCHQETVDPKSADASKKAEAKK